MRGIWPVAVDSAHDQCYNSAPNGVPEMSQKCRGYYWIWHDDINSVICHVFNFDHQHFPIRDFLTEICTSLKKNKTLITEITSRLIYWSPSPKFLNMCGVFRQYLKPAAASKSYCSDTIMSEMASQITGVSIVCLTVCTGAYRRKHQSSASLASVRGIHRSPVDSPHKGPVTRKNVSIWWRHYDIAAGGKLLTKTNNVGTLTMDLSKAFDSLPQGLCIAKLLRTTWV